MSRSGRLDGQGFLHAHERTSPFQPALNIRQIPQRAVRRIAMVIALILLTQTFSAAVGDASTGHFSQQQISSYLKSVTSELEVSKNWSANFGTSTTSKLNCQSVVLGEGVRSGNYGLYTWFTCSAIRKLDTSNSTKSNISCTGFSSPVWIEPKAGRIKYQPVTTSADYSSFRSSAPTSVQTVMDANYSLLNLSPSRVVIARAVQGSPVSGPGTSNICQ